MGPSLRAGEWTAKYGTETSTIALPGKVQNPNISRNWCLHFLGLTMPSSGTLSGEVYNIKKCAVQWDAYWQAEACNCSKLRGLLSKCVVLLHDNARPHTAETLRKLKFEVMTHPPYSPHHAPSDYHLFGPLKEALRGRCFTSDQEVKEAMHAGLAAQRKTFFSEVIRKLM